MSTLGIIITASLAQNVILVHYLGIWPLPAVLRTPERGALIGGAVTLSLVWVSLVFWALRRWVIVPLELYVLETLILASVIALSSIGAIRLGGQLFPFRRRLIKRMVPFVMINMTVFVVSMGLVYNVDSAGHVVVGALAAGAGLLLAIVPIAAVRVHFATANVPRLLRGDVPVYLATAIMAFTIQQIDQLLQQFLVPLF